MLEKFAERLSSNSLAIYLFHGVISDETTKIRNYSRKHLLVREFESFLDACMRKGGEPLAMDEVVRLHEQGKSFPERSFAISFDDGFLNNLENAVPILRKKNIPAIFYITTDFVDRNRMSWIDRVELAFEDRCTGNLDLPWGGREFDSVQTRIEILNEIRARVKADRSVRPDKLATEVQKKLLGEEVWVSEHPLDRKMTWEQVKDLHSIKGMCVGGHSHTHAMLAFLDDNALETEISTSVELMESRGGITSIHYSYPEGQEEHYDYRVIDKLKRRGIKCSPTAVDGINTEETGLFHLKRITVQ